MIHGLNGNHGGVVPLIEGPFLIQDEGQTTGHPGSKVPAGAAQHDHDAPRHVFTPMIADALYHGVGAAVADGEPLARAAGRVETAACRAIETCVADDRVLMTDEGRILGRRDHDLAAVHALADVVLRIAREKEHHATVAEGAEALARAATEVQFDGAVRKACTLVTARDLARETRADGAVGVSDRVMPGDRLTPLNSAQGIRVHPVVERIVGTVVPGLHVSSRPGPAGVRIGQDRREIQARRLPVLLQRLRLEQVSAADDLIHRPEPEFGQQLPHLLRDEEHEVDDMLRRARKLRP